MKAHWQRRARQPGSHHHQPNDNLSNQHVATSDSMSNYCEHNNTACEGVFANEPQEDMMSAQKKRRGIRTANRPQRLALGPASRHGSDIIRALKIFESRPRQVTPPSAVGVDQIETITNVKISTDEIDDHSRIHQSIHVQQPKQSTDIIRALEFFQSRQDTPYTGVGVDLNETTTEHETSSHMADQSRHGKRPPQSTDIAHALDFLKPQPVTPQSALYLSAIQKEATNDYETSSQPQELGIQQSDNGIRSSQSKTTQCGYIKPTSVEPDIPIVRSSSPTDSDRSVTDVTMSKSSADTVISISKTHPNEVTTTCMFEEPQEDRMAGEVHSSTDLVSELADIFPELNTILGGIQDEHLTKNQSQGPEELVARESYDKMLVTREELCVDEAVIEMLQPRVTCSILTMHDLSTFDTGKTLKNIADLVELGQGSYSRVYLARHTKTGTALAIKQPSRRSTNHTSLDGIVDDLETTRMRVLKEELIHLILSDSQFFPTLFGTLTIDNDVCLAIQCIGNPDLGITHSLLEPPPSLSVANGLDIAADVVKGMIELHGHGILHNDLKSDNVLLEYRGRRYYAVIIDFGMASLMTKPFRMTGLSEVIKMAYIHGDEADYIAPEVILLEEQTSTASDVFSVGRILMDIGEVVEDHRSLHIQQLTTTGFHCMKRDPVARPRLDNLLDKITGLRSNIKHRPFWKRMLTNFK